MTERKQTNPPFLTKLPETSISPVSQGFLARDSAFFSCEDFELPILEKRMEKFSFCFAFFSDLMIAMQEKKLIRIPLFLLPKTCKHRTQKHTIAPSRKPNCKFLLYRKKLLKERKELRKILMKRWKCLEMGEHYSVLLINGESIVKSSLIVKRKSAERNLAFRGGFTMIRSGLIFFRKFNFTLFSKEKCSTNNNFWKNMEKSSKKK